MPYARVQQSSNGANTAALTVTLGAGPTQGNLLVAWANSDETVTVGGTGWSAGPSVIDGNGAYAWYKIAGTGEPNAVTFTPGAGDYICAGLIEYNGAFSTAAASIDQSTSAVHSGSATSTTPTASLTPSTWNDLIVAIACLHAYGAAADPTAPVWTGGVANLQSQNSAGFTGHSAYTYYADTLDTGQGTATVSADCSWSTTQFSDAQLLLLAFQSPGKGITLGATASTAGTVARGPGVVAQAAAVTTPALARGVARTAAAASTTATTATRGLVRALSAAAGTAAALARSLARTPAAAASALAGLLRSLGRAPQATATPTSATARSAARVAAAQASSSAAVTASTHGAVSDLRVTAVRAVTRWSAREGGTP